MPATYEPISTTVLSSTQTQIDLTNIANTWTDLRLVIRFSTSTGGNCYITFNGDTNTNYGYLIANFDASSVNALCNVATSMPGNVGGNTGDSTRVNLFTWDIMSYASTSQWKPALVTWQEQIDYPNNSHTGFGSGIWKSNSAITSINIKGGSFLSGSIVSLFGIKGA